MKRIFVFKAGSAPQKVDAQLTLTAGELFKQVYPEAVTNTDNLEDFEIYLLGGENELRKDRSLEDQGVADKASLLITQCKKVAVEVIYNGKAYTVTYRSNEKFKEVFEKAIHHYSIGHREKDDFEFYLSEDAPSIINQSYPIGAYGSYPMCTLRVYLLRPSSFQGYAR